MGNFWANLYFDLFCFLIRALFCLLCRLLNETFGECGRPKIGWQIDPFGHSSEMASIFANMGYDGIFFSRVDWRDKTTRLLSKSMEMIWQGSRSLGNYIYAYRFVRNVRKNANFPLHCVRC